MGKGHPSLLEDPRTHLSSKPPRVRESPDGNKGSMAHPRKGEEAPQLDSLVELCSAGSTVGVWAAQPGGGQKGAQALPIIREDFWSGHSLL